MDTKVILAVTWAFLVGISIPLESCNTSLLNSKAKNTFPAGSSDVSWHGFYISDIAVAMGGMQLLIPSFYSKVEWKRPSKWWSYFGGVCSLLGFITVSAAPILGVQLMLMIQMIGLLGTFFLIDICLGSVKLSDWQKPVGFSIALLGVAIDNLSMFSDTSEITSSWMLHFVGTFLSGVGYALQARCNGALAEDLGGPARAASVSAVVNIVAGAPIILWIAFSLEVPVTLDLWLWPLWLVAGFQSAFYIGSMAMLPKILGFTTCYLAVLSSKLVCSSFVDEFGLGGKVVEITWNRIVSLAVVILGSFIFNSASLALPAEEALLEDPTGADDVEKSTGADNVEKTAKTADNVPLENSAPACKESDVHHLNDQITEGVDPSC